MRGRIDVSEIEADTKIRVKYLRALENETVGAAAQPTSSRPSCAPTPRRWASTARRWSRTIAQPAEPPRTFEPIVGPSRRGASPAARGLRAAIVTAAIVSGVIVLLIVGLLASGGGSSGRTPRAAAAQSRGAARVPPPPASSPPGSRIVTLSMKATGTVYVCLLGEGGRGAVPGRTLTAGERRRRSRPALRVERW